MDEATGHYFYGFRMYDPAIARFTGVDPIADQFPHLSVYNYASNDPIKHIDLHGLQGVLPSEVKALGNRIESAVQSAMNTLSDIVEPIETAVNAVGEAVFEATASLMGQIPGEGKSREASDYHDNNSDALEGEGVTLLSNTGIQAEGMAQTSEAKGGSSVILEQNEIYVAPDAGGPTGGFLSKYAGVPGHAIHNGAKSVGRAVDSGIIDTNNNSSRTEPFDTIGSVAGYPNHRPSQLPTFVRNANKQVIDTLPPLTRSQK